MQLNFLSSSGAHPAPCSALFHGVLVARMLLVIDFFELRRLVAQLRVYPSRSRQWNVSVGAPDTLR